MNYILSKKLYLRIKENRDKHLEIKKIKSEQMSLLLFLDSIENEVNETTNYSKENKVRLNEIKNLLISRLEVKGCWINYALDKCLKKELPSKIRIVALRTRESINENQKEIIKWLDELDISDKESLDRKLGDELMMEIYNNEYYKHIREMFDQRQWDCMVDLIEDGTVKRNELIDYGIELN